MRDIRPFILCMLSAVGCATRFAHAQETMPTGGNPEARIPVPAPVKDERLAGLGGMGFGGPGLGAPGYRATWYPNRSIDGSSSDLGLVRQSLIGAVPVWRDERDTLLLTAGLRHTLFSTDAMLPDTGRSFPDQLWNVSMGLMDIRRFENGWTGGLSITIGSASDRPFHSIDEMNATLLGFLKIPTRNDRDSWLLSIMYSPVGNLTFPLPGLAYMWKPSDTFQMTIGLPFAVRWNPIEDLTLTFSYIPVTNINARAAYRLREELEAYAAFEWLNEAYLLANRESRNDRFLAFEKRLVVGIRWDIARHAALDANAGYAFDRYYGEGQNQFSNLRDQMNIDPGAFLGLSLLVRW